MAATMKRSGVPAHVGKLWRDELVQVLIDLLPPGFRRLRRLIRYRKLAPGAYISPDSCVSREAKIGYGCVLTKCQIEASARIGDYTCMGDFCFIGGRERVEIGKFCLFANNVFAFSTSHNHKVRTAYPVMSRLLLDESALEREYLAAPVSIGNDVWLGRDVKVLPGAVIPDGCVVGAGAVVLRNGNWEPYTILAGVPARPLRKRFPDREIQRLMDRKWWDSFEDMSREELTGFLLREPEEP